VVDRHCPSSIVTITEGDGARFLNPAPIHARPRVTVGPGPNRIRARPRTIADRVLRLHALQRASADPGLRLPAQSRVLQRASVGPGLRLPVLYSNPSLPREITGPNRTRAFWTWTVSPGPNRTRALPKEIRVRVLSRARRRVSVGPGLPSPARLLVRNRTRALQRSAARVRARQKQTVDRGPSRKCARQRSVVRVPVLQRDPALPKEILVHQKSPATTTSMMSAALWTRSTRVQ
jgi:hypothetical protein